MSTFETRKISLHPLAIHTFIKAQAGSFGKAVSEAVMNSIDASADVIEVTLTANGFSIKDNGVGFTSKEEIESWFETIGFPHDDANHRVYGKFGMGRAQMWAFASTVWTSNQFLMDVDVANRGLDYRLEHSSEGFKGTHIQGTFYRALESLAEVVSIEREIVELVQFAPASIRLNGRPISVSPASIKWDDQNDYGWYKKTENGRSGLRVYNAGVLVAAYPHWRFDASGILMSRADHALALNVARNSILESECKVWPKLKALLPSKKQAQVIRKRSLTEALKSAKGNIVTTENDLVAFLAEYSEALVNPAGRTICLNEFRAQSKVLFFSQDDKSSSTKAAKDAFRQKAVMVVNDRVLVFLGLTSLEELKAIIKPAEDAIWTYDSKVAVPGLCSERLVSEKGLEPIEKAVFSALNAAKNELRAEACMVHRFIPGSSKVLTHWMHPNEDRQVVLDVKFMRRLVTKPLPDIQVALLAAIEPNFKGSDAEFKNWLMSSTNFSQFTCTFVNRFIGICRNKNIDLHKENLRQAQFLAPTLAGEDLAEEESKELAEAE